jgi:K+-sensing histidine kinase KdpD
MGWSSELIGQVFDPYVTTKTKGTGLGLAIVRKIVKNTAAHRGRQLRRRRRTGTSICRCVKQRRTTRHRRGSLGGDAYDNARILVVDDRRHS